MIEYIHTNILSYRDWFYCKNWRSNRLFNLPYPKIVTIFDSGEKMEKRSFWLYAPAVASQQYIFQWPMGYPFQKYPLKVLSFYAIKCPLALGLMWNVRLSNFSTRFERCGRFNISYFLILLCMIFCYRSNKRRIVYGIGN